MNWHVHCSLAALTVWNTFCAQYHCSMINKHHTTEMTSYLPLNTNCESGLNDASRGIPFWLIWPWQHNCNASDSATTQTYATNTTMYRPPFLWSFSRWTLANQFPCPLFLLHTLHEKMPVDKRHIMVTKTSDLSANFLYRSPNSWQNGNYSHYTANSSQTPDVAVFTLPMPTLSRSDIKLGRFKRLLKTFLFSETAAH